MPNLDTISNQISVDTLQATVSKPAVIIHDTIYKVVEQTTKSADDAIQFVSHSDNNNIPILLILGLLLITVALFVGFRLLNDYIAPFIESKYKIRKPYLTIYRFKILVWFLFIVFAFYQLITSNYIVGIAMAIFVSVLGFNFWKDFFAGVYLKLDGRFYVNDRIEINNIKGKITKLHTRNLELLSQKDEIITIPYHHFLNATVAKKLNKGEERSRTITLMVNNKSDYNSVKAIEGLLNICPWIYSHKQSIVKRNHSTDNETEYLVSIYVSDSFTLKKVESFLVDHTTIKKVHYLED